MDYKELFFNGLDWFEQVVSVVSEYTVSGYKFAKVYVRTWCNKKEETNVE